MVFNAIFNNMSVISCRVSFIGGGHPEKTTDLSQVTDKLSYTCNVSSIHVLLVSEIRTTNLSGDGDTRRMYTYVYFKFKLFD